MPETFVEKGSDKNEETANNAPETSTETANPNAAGADTQTVAEEVDMEGSDMPVAAVAAVAGAEGATSTSMARSSVAEKRGSTGMV